MQRMNEEMNGVNEVGNGVNEEGNGVNEAGNGVNEAGNGVNEEGNGVNEEGNGIDEELNGMDEAVERWRMLPIALFSYVSATTNLLSQLREQLRTQFKMQNEQPIVELLELTHNDVTGQGWDGILVMTFERMVTVDQLLRQDNPSLRELQEYLRQMLRRFHQDWSEKELARVTLAPGNNMAAAAQLSPQRQQRFAEFVKRGCPLPGASPTSLLPYCDFACDRAVALYGRLQRPLGEAFNGPLLRSYLSRLNIKEFNRIYRHFYTPLLEGFDFGKVMGKRMGDLLLSMLHSRDEPAGVTLHRILSLKFNEFGAVILFELLEGLDLRQRSAPPVTHWMMRRWPLLRWLPVPACFLAPGGRQPLVATLHRLTVRVCANGAASAAELDPPVGRFLPCARLELLPYSVAFEDFRGLGGDPQRLAEMLLPLSEQQAAVYLFLLDEPLFAQLLTPGTYARALLQRCLSTGRPLYFVYRDREVIFRHLLELADGMAPQGFHNIFQRDDVDTFRFPRRPTSDKDFVTMRNLLYSLRRLDEALARP